jgi:serine protease
VLNRYYKVTVAPDTDLSTLAAQVMETPDVELAVPNDMMEIDRIPNDPYFEDCQWVLDDTRQAKLHVPLAWEITTGSAEVIVAVLDTGLDTLHGDINAKNTGTGINYTANPPNNDIRDADGHGTNVAGVIGAVTNNGIDVAGMSWGARIMPIKANDTESMVRGIEYAEQRCSHRQYQQGQAGDRPRSR